MNDIYDALKNISIKKRTYFINRHSLHYQIDTEKKTDEELCELLGVKSLSEYLKWERTQEYNLLLNLYLQTKFAGDLEQIYKVTQEKAVEGDEKAIKLLLDIQKQIRLFNKENSKKTDNVDIYDGLET